MINLLTPSTKTDSRRQHPYWKFKNLMKPDPDAVLFVSRTQYTLQLGAGNVRQQNKLTIVTLIWNVLTVPPSWLCREVWNGCFFSLKSLHVMRIPECEKFLLVESGLLGFGIRNTAEVLRIPDNNWNPESKFHLKLIRNPVLGVPSPERRIQNWRQSWIT